MDDLGKVLWAVVFIIVALLILLANHFSVALVVGIVAITAFLITAKYVYDLIKDFNRKNKENP